MKPTVLKSSILGCVVAAAALLSGEAPARAQNVTVGLPAVVSDAPFFIAQANGYFKDEGLTVRFEDFKTGAQMIAPLGSGEIDVGAGAPSVGLYNAAARGLGIMIVADKGHVAPGYPWQAVMVRKALFDSGKVKTLADLKGLRVATTAVGATETSILDVALRSAGLTLKDVHQVYLAFPEQGAAMANGAIDASLTSEPTNTFMVRAGSAVRFVGVDKFYPGHQTSVVLYSGRFIKDRPEVARKFMVAYLRAARFYNGALANGKFAGPNADRVISILTQYAKIKDPAIYHALVPSVCDPNGALDMASLGKDFAFFQQQKMLNAGMTIGQVVDQSFARSAAAKLGPYKPAP
jgi:NitT/TauT family transport system substrate-binding protein